MIQTIVDDCLRDGQFDECDLTMRDLALIVDTLEKTVSTMFHHRIDYPGFDFEPERTRKKVEPQAVPASAEPDDRPAAVRPRPAVSGGDSAMRSPEESGGRHPRAVWGAPAPPEFAGPRLEAARAAGGGTAGRFRVVLRRPADGGRSIAAGGERRVPTDVLSFPVVDLGARFLGDIVISVPYATRQARRRGDSPPRKMDRLLVHGYLHLLGYDHETDDGEMDALEAKMRARLGIAERP